MLKRKGGSRNLHAKYLEGETGTANITYENEETSTGEYVRNRYVSLRPISFHSSGCAFWTDLSSQG